MTAFFNFDGKIIMGDIPQKKLSAKEGVLTMKKISQSLITGFKEHLMYEEKSPSTISKYIRDVTEFGQCMGERVVTKADVINYKQNLIEKYSPASVNSVLSSLNCFFLYCEWYELRVKTLKIQRKIFSAVNKELTKEEYERLLKAALNLKNKRLYYLMQTICSTGIRVSELKFITVESLSEGRAVINCKGKMREVIIPSKLCKILKKYANQRGINTGCIFCTSTGKPIDRSNIWSDMKKLCKSANVEESKVFPHNLRHLFARTYYSLQKDIVRLADILGHSNVNTTRIYTIESGEVHRKQIQRLGLLMC